MCPHIVALLSNLVYVRAASDYSTTASITMGEAADYETMYADLEISRKFRVSKFASKAVTQLNIVESFSKFGR